MIRRPPRSTLDRSSAASDVYKRQWEYYNQNWTHVAPTGSIPTSDSGHRAVFDPSRDGVVTFGGSSPAETWTYNGSWTKLQPALSPPPSAFMGLSYDDTRNAVVLFT